MLRINFYDLSENGNVGDWAFINDDFYICIKYPRKGHEHFNNDDIVVLAINPLVGKGAIWNWNGNRDAPTLTPSIGIGKRDDGTFLWHGYLTDGKLIDA